MSQTVDNFVFPLLLLVAMSAAAASGQEIDLKAMILMPGPLIAAHAQEESNCQACHSSFDKSAQGALCLECHEEIAEDMDSGSGYHGLAPDPRELECKGCHRDHKGREFDSTALDRDTFDHRQTDFPLSGEHSGLTCDSCHDRESYRDATGTCQACHGEQEPHQGHLGDDCGGCHSPDGWHTDQELDHSTTDFALRGEHLNVPCASCHAGERYSFETTVCSGCHGVEDVHDGQFGDSCDSCHTEDSWAEGSFDHDTQTGFRLTGAHAQQSCQGCHHRADQTEALKTECNACHDDGDVHGGRHGKECAGCHNTQQWDVDKFDHRDASGWPLEGAHTKLTCLQCHQGSLDEPLGTGCRDCHQADDVHRSEKMLDCAACHRSASWQPASGFDHELSGFPLEGMHAVTSCKACHRTARYQSTGITCVACHEGDDNHFGAFGSECGSCHSPNGWLLWLFDHDRQTEFTLEGVHGELGCNSCHSEEDRERQVGDCGTCHTRDDRHRGQFGMQCGNCHNSDSFGDVKWPD